MNDEQFFLANAYLDGELTADERAIAEADPAVMAEVEELRALQALIRDVEPPSATAREDAIAAAMAEFGATGAAAASTPASSASPTASTRSTAPIPFRPRPAYAKYLAVAAGVLGVGLLGVAVANLPAGDGDDSIEDSAAQPAAEEPASEPAERLPETLSDEAAEDASDEAADGGSDAAGDAPAAEMATADDEPADMPAEEPASEPAEEPASEPASEPGDEDVAPRPALAPDQVLTSPEELGSFGTGLLEQQLDGTLPPTPNHACDIDDVLGTAEYLAGDIQRTVLVAVDEAADLVLAFDRERCEYVAQGPLYEPFAP